MVDRNLIRFVQKDNCLCKEIISLFEKNNLSLAFASLEYRSKKNDVLNEVDCKWNMLIKDLNTLFTKRKDFLKYEEEFKKIQDSTKHINMVKLRGMESLLNEIYNFILLGECGVDEENDMDDEEDESEEIDKSKVFIENGHKEELTLSESEKKPMLLISHATEDKKYVEAVVNLLENIGLNQTHIVCSSIPGFGIPLGNDIYEWLASRFIKLDLQVLFILSDRYYSSAPCLNEMGAAWVTKSEYTSILLPGFEFSQIRGAINPRKVSIKLDSDEEELKQRLNEMKDKLTEVFGITKIVDTRWEKFRGDFVDEIKKIKFDQDSKKVRSNQPSFAVKINAVNKQLPGTAEFLKADFSGGMRHSNLQFSIEIINEKPARNLIVFDKLLTTVLKPGERCSMSVAYEDSEDVIKWPSRVNKILHSEYEDDNGLPKWFNICYQDEDGHNMVQSIVLRSFEGDSYYDLDGYPWET